MESLMKVNMWRAYKKDLGYLSGQIDLDMKAIEKAGKVTEKECELERMELLMKVNLYLA